MKLIKNLRHRRTTVALPGLGLHLAPRGTMARGLPADQATLLDEEVDDPAVKQLLAAKAVEILPAPSTATAERSPETMRARSRIASVERARAKSKVRSFLHAEIAKPHLPAAFIVEDERRKDQTFEEYLAETSPMDAIFKAPVDVPPTLPTLPSTGSEDSDIWPLTDDTSDLEQ